MKRHRRPPAAASDRKAQTQSNLLEAAATLLDQGGPAAVTLREVGRLAAVSHNAPYRHFADKEDLLAAIAARELTQLRSMMDRAGASESPLEALKLCTRGYADWARRFPNRFRLIFAAWTKQSHALGEAASAAQTAIVALVAAAQAKRQLQPCEPQLLAYALLSTLHGACELHLNGHLSADGKGGADPEQIADLVLLSFARKN